MAKYEILTWDIDLQKWTPQRGCPQFVEGRNELRRAMRTLNRLGYPDDSPCLSVERWPSESRQ